MQDPQFENQTKIKLTGNEMEPSGGSARTFVGNFLQKEPDPSLHRNKAVADAWVDKIISNEQERKELAGVAKLARDRAKKGEDSP